TIELGFWFKKVSQSEIQEPPPSEHTWHTYAGSDVIAICYDCSRPETLHNAIYKWHPMILHHGPNVPVVLVGCRSDLKSKDPKQSSMSFVTTEEAKKAARQIGAVDALEFSSNDGKSTKKIGDRLVWYAYYSHFGFTESPSK
ncbi:P-loop containing nucleoside triphosphate hydrolase protein, partial [Serendipita vermifera]